MILPKLKTINAMMAAVGRPSTLLTMTRSIASSSYVHVHSFQLQTKKGSRCCRLNHVNRLFSANSINATNQDPSNSKVELDTHTNNRAIVHRSQGPTVLDPIEDAVTSCLAHYKKQSPSSFSSIPMNAHINILQYPANDRESIGVCSNLQQTLNSFGKSGVHCRRCWLQKRHCICGVCEELGEIPSIKRLFLLTHHKEICLAVDTAKLIVSSFPQNVQLVVGGIPREFQPAMGEMLDIVSLAKASTCHDVLEGNGTKCLILFPTADAVTFSEITDGVTAKMKEISREGVEPTTMTIGEMDHGWNVIVIDGTWSQARKLHAKYLPEESNGMLFRVQLSSDAVEKLDGFNSVQPIHDKNDNGVGAGFQLRRHPIKWREISTLEATRLLLLDMHPDGQFDTQSEAMSKYQELGNAAVKRQLGPPRHQV